MTETSARMVLTTFATAEDARRLGRTLVEEKLAACATVIPRVESIYRWEGKLETAAEAMLLLKTEAERLPALEQRLHELHSYDTPEFLVLRVDGGSERYLEWLHASMQSG